MLSHAIYGQTEWKQINGEFKGWDGETIFKMLNGQIWHQSSCAYMYHYAYNPSVVISKSGTKWEMKVEGVDQTIEVRKIKWTII